MRKILLFFSLSVLTVLPLFASGSHNVLDDLFFNNIKKFDKKLQKNTLGEHVDYQELLIEYLLFDPFQSVDEKKRTTMAGKIFKSLETVQYLEGHGADIRLLTREDFLGISQDLMTDGLFEYILQKTDFSKDYALWLKWFSSASRITTELQHSLDLLVKYGFHPEELLKISKNTPKYHLMLALLDNPAYVDNTQFDLLPIESKWRILLIYAKNAGYNMLAYHLSRDYYLLKTVTHTSTYTTGGYWVSTGPNGQGHYSPPVTHTRYHTFDEQLIALKDKYVDDAIKKATFANKNAKKLEK